MTRKTSNLRFLGSLMLLAAVGLASSTISSSSPTTAPAEVPSELSAGPVTQPGNYKQ